MAPKAHTQRSPSRSLRGAGGLRGVRSRQGQRSTGSRASSGRGPTAPERRDRTSALPRAIDRIQPLSFSGLGGPIAGVLLAPTDGPARPLIVAWGNGGTRRSDLRADESWARELCDLTGAIVVLCGYRRADPSDAGIDAAVAFADLIARGEQLGGDLRRVAVTGHGYGFRLATRLAGEAAGWPTLPTPRHCVAATPTSIAASALRESLTLPPAPAPRHGLRVGAEVFSSDGVRLGRIDAVRAGDVVVRRGLTLEDVAVPQRLLHATQGAVIVDVRAAAIPLRNWGRAATDLHAAPPLPGTWN